MKETRRRFSREFKVQAVRQLKAGNRLADVARALGVNATVLRRWQGQVTVDPATAFPGNGRVAQEEDELQRLRKEVVQLRAERDFLKKVAVGSRRNHAPIPGAEHDGKLLVPGPALRVARRLAERLLCLAAAPTQRPRPRESAARGGDRRIHAEVDRSYGSPRMHPELVARGLACGRHRVARLMRVQGIRGKQARRFQVTTDSRHRFTVAPNRLGRAFAAAAPNRVWMGDLTFIPTSQGWCYLAVLIDAFSRRVVGWALDTQPSAELPLTAWRQAVAARHPGPGLLHHSDPGWAPAPPIKRCCGSTRRCRA